MARAEVSEDTGYNTVRVDIALDAKNVIEVKCTRKGMVQKKLIEEIEADMVHYSAECIYFFIYDKLKIIENPQNFRETKCILSDTAVWKWQRAFACSRRF